MDIKLISMSIINFKGIRKFSLDPNPGVTRIYGDNATGKTTLMDAWLWLLFGKDSQGKADFAIKPLEESGAERHNLDSTVEAVMTIDGRQLALKKVYREKWTKKRGQATATFTGHEYDYYLDDVPVKKGEYLQEINGLAGEDIFRLLTDPYHFPGLPWQKQRQVLMNIAGPIDDSGLDEITKGKTAEDHRKVIAEKKRKINKRLQDIPGRIDELISMNKVDVAGMGPKEIREAIQDIEAEIRQAEADSGKGAMEAQLRELQEEKRLLIKNNDNSFHDELTKWNRHREAAVDELNSATAKHDALVREATALNDKCSDARAELSKLEEREEEIRTKEATPIETHCPACNQELPEASIQNTIEQLKIVKSQQLELIAKQKERAADKIKAMQAELRDINAAAKKQSAIAISLSEKDRELGTFRPQRKPIDTSVIDKQIAELRGRIADDAPLDTDDLRHQVDEYRQQLANIENSEKGKKRIAELEAETKMLSAEYEDLERQLHLVEEHTRKVASLIEERINNLFKLVRFKMFEEQINGGVSDTCEVLVEGVPYHRGLNHAAQINAGLDIINTLGGHYDVTAPIWIDNAEAVTSIMETRSQTIELIVSDHYDEMNVD